MEIFWDYTVNHRNCSTSAREIFINCTSSEDGMQDKMEILSSSKISYCEKCMKNYANNECLRRHVIKKHYLNSNSALGMVDENRRISDENLQSRN